MNAVLRTLIKALKEQEVLITDLESKNVALTQSLNELQKNILVKNNGLFQSYKRAASESVRES